MQSPTVVVYSTFRCCASVDVEGLNRIGGVGKSEILLNSAMYRAIFGIRFGADESCKPWKRGIVAIEGMKSAGLFLRYRSAGIEGLTNEIALVHPETYSRISACANNRQNREDGGISITIFAATGLKGKWSFYWNHPDDQARVSFKLGFIGVLLGILSILIALPSLCGWI